MDTLWQNGILCIRADKINEKKLWTTGTDAEKKLITDKIQTALGMAAADGDSDMVGAWMPEFRLR